MARSSKGLELKASLIDQINQSTEGAFSELKGVELRDEYRVLNKNAIALDFGLIARWPA